MTKFIVFKGIDRSGKTTQLNRLYHYLKEREIRFFITREPYNESVREKLKTTALTAEEQLDLVLKDRAEHCHLIRHMKENSDIVLCDRFTASTIAYQGAGQELDIYRLNIANEIVTQGLKPDLTLVIDCPVGVAVKRGTDKPLDVLERDFYLLERVRTSYLNQARRNGYTVIDGDRSEEEVFSDVLAAVSSVIPLLKTTPAS